MKQLNTFITKEPIIAMKLIDSEAHSMVTITKTHLQYWNPEQQSDKRLVSMKPQYSYPNLEKDSKADIYTSLAVVDKFIIVGTAGGMLRIFQLYDINNNNQSLKNNMQRDELAKPVWGVRPLMDKASPNQPISLHSEAEQYAVLDMVYTKSDLHVLYQGGRVCTFRNISEGLNTYNFRQKVPYWCVQPLATRIAVSERYPNYLFAANFISVKCFTIPSEKDVNMQGDKKLKVPFVHVSENSAYDTAVSNTTCLAADGDYLLLGSGYGHIGVWRIQETEVIQKVAQSNTSRQSLIIMKKEKPEMRMTFSLIGTWWVHGCKVTAACLNLKKVSVLTFDADGCFVETGIRQGDERSKDIVHQDKVTGAQLVSDKGLLITCAGDRMAKVWQAYEQEKDELVDENKEESALRQEINDKKYGKAENNDIKDIYQSEVTKEKANEKNNEQQMYTEQIQEDVYAKEKIAKNYEKDRTDRNRIANESGTQQLTKELNLKDKIIMPKIGELKVGQNRPDAVMGGSEGTRNKRISEDHQNDVEIANSLYTLRKEAFVPAPNSHQDKVIITDKAAPILPQARNVENLGVTLKRDEKVQMEKLGAAIGGKKLYLNLNNLKPKVSNDKQIIAKGQVKRGSVQGEQYNDLKYTQSDGKMGNDE